MFLFFRKEQRRRHVRPGAPLPVDVAVQRLYYLDEMGSVPYLPVVGEKPLRVFVRHLVLPFRLGGPDLAEPQRDADVPEELRYRGVYRLPAAGHAHYRGHVVREHLLRQPSEGLEGVYQASSEISLLLELRVLKVMEARVAEGGAEEVELQHLAVDRRELHRLHPVHLELLARVGLVERVRGGLPRLVEQAPGPHESLEVVVFAPYPPFVPHEPVGGLDADAWAREELRYLLLVAVELGRLLLPRGRFLAFVHCFDRVPVLSEGAGKLTEVWHHVHSF